MKQASRLLASIAATIFLGGVAVAQTTTTTTITTEQTGKVKSYVMKEKKPSIRVTEKVTVGETLPARVELYAFPSDVGVTNYRYSIVNDKTVLVEPSSRKIIQIIE